MHAVYKIRHMTLNKVTLLLHVEQPNMKPYLTLQTGCYICSFEYHSYLFISPIREIWAPGYKVLPQR